MMKFRFFWYVTSYHCVSSSRRFERSWCFHRQCQPAWMLRTEALLLAQGHGVAFRKHFNLR